MSDTNSIQTNLAEIAVEMSGKVAELLAYAARNSEPETKKKIEQMIENSVADVVTSTLFKTTVLHSAKGIDHLKSNMDHYANQMAQRMIHNDM
jgi:hypothetical protein